MSTATSSSHFGDPALELPPLLVEGERLVWSGRGHIGPALLFRLLPVAIFLALWSLLLPLGVAGAFATNPAVGIYFAVPILTGALLGARTISLAGPSVYGIAERRAVLVESVGGHRETSVFLDAVPCTTLRRGRLGSIDFGRRQDGFRFGGNAIRRVEGADEAFSALVRLMAQPASGPTDPAPVTRPMWAGRRYDGEIVPYLTEGEVVLWTGRSDRRSRVRGVSLFPIGLGVIWVVAASGIFLMTTRALLGGATSPFPFMVIPLASVGLALAAGVWVHVSANRSRITYAVTDRRVLRASRFTHPRLMQISLADLRVLTLRGGRVSPRGDLRFAGRDGKKEVRIDARDLPDAADVSELVTALRLNGRGRPGL